MKVWVGLQHYAYESYEGITEVFLNEEAAGEWVNVELGSVNRWRDIYEVEAS